MPLWKWSKTAATNATADPTGVWPEGMAPSQINDSARGNMAAVAQYRDDISGALITTGTSTAYVVATNSGLSNPPPSGTMISFVAHVTSGVSPSLTVDGSGPYQIWDSTSSWPPAGTLIVGVPYTVMWNGSVWRLKHSFGNPYNIPIGGYLDYAGAGSPNSAFAQPAGQAVSRATYSALFALINTVYGPGDGSTTFNLPDLRGRVCVTSDNFVGAAAAAGRSPGYEQVGAAGGAQMKSLSLFELPSANLTLTGTPGLVAVTTVSNNIVAASSVNDRVSGPDSGAYSVIGGSGSVSGAQGSTGTFTPQGTIYNGGGNVAFSLMQPSYTVNKLLRVI